MAATLLKVALPTALEAYVAERVGSKGATTRPVNISVRWSRRTRSVGRGQGSIGCYTKDSIPK